MATMIVKKQEVTGFSLEKLSIKPRKKLLVLGFNGLLVYRVFRYNKAGFPTTRDPNGRHAHQLGLNCLLCLTKMSALTQVSSPWGDRKKPFVFKPLEKMWNYFHGKYSESDKLLIDDQPYQALPHISIFMESYNPDNALDPKGELGVYLDGLAAANNVQVYVKENPFGLPAISNDHPDWNFYSNALHGLEDKI
ncbi:hypothetical protein ACLB2K_063719 [Fragaria x ananassa]